MLQKPLGLGKRMPKRLISEVPDLPEHGLRALCGDTVIARILDFLTLYRGSTYSMSEIARNSHVSWRAFNRVWPRIVRLGVVIEESKSHPKLRLYKFNEKSPIAQALDKLATEVALLRAEEVAEKELTSSPKR